MLRFKRILLANPPNVKQGGYTPSPLGILYLAGYLRQNKKLKIDVIDASIEPKNAFIEKINKFKPDLVGLSSLTPGRHEALKSAILVKSLLPGCKVVLGGVHPTIMWKQIMDNYPFIDYIIRGEGEWN